MWMTLTEGEHVLKRFETLAGHCPGSVNKSLKIFKGAESTSGCLGPIGADSRRTFISYAME